MQSAEHARVPFPPPLLFLGFLVLGAALQAVLPLPVPWPDAARYVGWLSLGAGALLGWWALLTLRRAHTSVDPGQPTTALVTEGPYGMARNPIYLGFTLVLLGFSLMAGTWWGLLLAPALVLTATRVIIRREEVYLLARFGERYRHYIARVRRWAL